LAKVNPKLSSNYYVDEIRDFPVNLSPYVPADEFEEGEDSSKFSTKIELGKKLVLDAIEKGIQFKEALFDNWYLCYDFVSFIRDQRKDWISTLKSDDIIYRVNKRRRIRKKKKHRTKKRGREFTVEKLVNSLSPPGISFPGEYHLIQVGQFSMHIYSNKDLQRWKRGKKIHLGSKF
jgi:hypothetical protein